MFSLFKKNAVKAVGDENSCINPKLSGLWDMIHGSSQYYASMSLAYNLYETTAPLSDAIDTIIVAAKGLLPEVYDTGWEKIENHQLIRFLQKPNRDQSWREFFADCCVNKLVTNNMFVIATGNISHEIVELYSVKSSIVSVVGRDPLNRPIYQISTASKDQSFNGIYKFDPVTKTFSDSKYRELIHLKGYSRNQSDDFFGLPLMNSILKEVEQANGSAIHNLNLLKNGVSLSGIFRLATNDQKAIAQFREDVSNYFTGSANAGKYIAAHADNIDFKPINATNRDMQIVELKNIAEDAIYRKYNIPTPLYKQSSQTYDNYATAKTSLYDDAVFPLVDDILAKFKELFVRRKMLTDGFYLGYSQADIPALQHRSSQYVRELSQVGVLTDNELRAELGYSRYEGGDKVYKQMSLIPVGDDSEIISDASSEDLSDQSTTDSEQKQFINRLVSLGYTKEVATSIWTQVKQQN